MVKYEKKDGAFGSYIVYEIDDVDSETAENETIELKMLKNNKIPGVLTYDIRYMDDKFCLYYDIKDMISMKDAINIKSVGYNELCRIYTAVIQIAKSCKKYLISFKLSLKTNFLPLSFNSSTEKFDFSNTFTNSFSILPFVKAILINPQPPYL